MSPEYSSRFYHDNVLTKLPDLHVALFLNTAVGVKNGSTAVCWHCNVDLQLTKQLLEGVLSQVNERIENAEG